MPKNTEIEIKKGRQILIERGMLMGEKIVDLAMSQLIQISQFTDNMVDVTKLMVGYYTSGLYQHLNNGNIYTPDEEINYMTPSIISPIIEDCTQYIMKAIQSSRLEIAPKICSGIILSKSEKRIVKELENEIAKQFNLQIANSQVIAHVVDKLLKLGECGLMVWNDDCNQVRLRYLDTGTYYITMDDNTREPLSYWRNQMYGYTSFHKTFECDDKDMTNIDRMMNFYNGVLVQHVTERGDDGMWTEYAVAVDNYGMFADGVKTKIKTLKSKNEKQESDSRTLDLGESGAYLHFKNRTTRKSSLPHFKVHTINNANRLYGTSPLLPLVQHISTLQQSLETEQKIVSDTITPNIVTSSKFATDNNNIEGNDGILLNPNPTILRTSGDLTAPPEQMLPTRIQITNGIDSYQASINMYVEIIRNHFGIGGISYLNSQPKSNVTTAEVNNRSEAFSVQLTSLFNGIWGTVGKHIFDHILLGIGMDILSTKTTKFDTLKKLFRNEQGKVTLEHINYKLIREGYDFTKQYEQQEVQQALPVLLQLLETGSPEVRAKIDMKEVINVAMDAYGASTLLNSDAQADAIIEQEQQEAARAQLAQQQQQEQQQQLTQSTDQSGVPMNMGG